MHLVLLTSLKIPHLDLLLELSSLTIHPTRMLLSYFPSRIFISPAGSCWILLSVHNVFVIRQMARLVFLLFPSSFVHTPCIDSFQLFDIPTVPRSVFAFGLCILNYFRCASGIVPAVDHHNWAIIFIGIAS